MKVQAWLNRLSAQLPGWHVWVGTFEGSGGRWHAVPAPADVRHDETLTLPGRLDFRTPQALRDACRERHGWYDHCESCGVLARECGHRQPESSKGDGS
jgi:hypothetical protein